MRKIAIESEDKFKKKKTNQKYPQNLPPPK